MKRIFYYALVMFLPLLAACSDNSTNDFPTTEQMRQAVSNMKGNYTGKADVYLIENGMAQESTTVENVTWTADESITINNFPVASLAAGVLSNNELKTAMANYTTTQSLPLNYIYCYSAETNNYAFSLQPSTIQCTMEFGGLTHTVRIEFVEYAGYSYVKGTNSTQTIQVVINNIFVDNVATQLQPMGVTFTSTNKTALSTDL